MDEINDKLRAAEGEFDTLVGMRIGSFNIGLLLTRPVRTEEDQRAIEANNIAMMDSNGNIPPGEFRVPRREYLSSQHILLEIPEAIFDRINRDAHYVMPVVTTREGLNNLGVPYERMKVGMITQQISPDGAYDRRGVAIIFEKEEYRNVAQTMLFKIANRKEGANFFGHTDADAMIQDIGRTAYVASVENLLQQAGLPKAAVEALKGKASRSDNFEFLEVVANYQKRVVAARVKTGEPGEEKAPPHP